MCIFFQALLSCQNQLPHKKGPTARENYKWSEHILTKEPNYHQEK